MLLDVRDATITFGGLHAVDHVSLSVDEGKIVGLIGPNGAGKTTLFNSISGLQPLDSGAIVFRDQDVTALAAHERAALGIGRSFQHLGLMMDESVETNLLAAQHLSADRWRRRERVLLERANTALESCGLTDDRHRAVKDLSFAAARFAELAAVMVEQPTLMLLDEPTTGLDVTEVTQLQDQLLHVRDDGTTILVIAHDVGFVMGLCDRVYVLAQGQLLAEGTPKQIRRNRKVVDAYLGRAA